MKQEIAKERHNCRKNDSEKMPSTLVRPNIAMVSNYRDHAQDKMALIACPECQAQISSTAMKCPSCAFVLKKPKRGFFGKLFKWGFILFNALMAWWMVAGMSAASKHIESAASSAEQAGATVGTGLGAMMIMGIWLFGAVVLGLFVLFTRPKSS